MKKELFIVLALFTLPSIADEASYYDQNTQNNIHSTAPVYIMPNANINIIEQTQQIQQIENNSNTNGKNVEYPPSIRGDDYPVGTTRIIRSR